MVPGPAGHPRLGAGFGISQATAYRFKDEAVEVLAAKAPTLREALEKAAEQGLPYLILDGTLISSDRRADKKTSKKGKEIDKWYSGKDLPGILADSGYEGAGAGVHVPVKSRPAASSIPTREPAARSCGPGAARANAASR